MIQAGLLLAVQELESTDWMYHEPIPFLPHLPGASSTSFAPTTSSFVALAGGHGVSGTAYSGLDANGVASWADTAYNPTLSSSSTRRSIGDPSVSGGGGIDDRLARALALPMSSGTTRSGAYARIVDLGWVDKMAAQYAEPNEGSNALSFSSLFAGSAAKRYKTEDESRRLTKGFGVITI